MASMALTTTLPKFQSSRAIIVRSPWSSRAFVGVTPKPFQMIQKTKNVAGKVVDASKDMTDKAKQTAQGAWGSVKDTTQKIKETVVAKAEEAKEFVKENAEKVERKKLSTLDVHHQPKHLPLIT
ncbi:hypothetical protein ACH5RR_020359 [Cinchona calisaya]|uniref:Uncharacterized protein n=1 Tax=Cinchona calisaya TaxID=153742 RepID=A0ABD2ZHN3_9GENT